MKAIFLDHDGVICLAQQWGSRFKKGKEYLGRAYTDVPVECRFDNFDRKAIKTLNEILTESGAEIIISSDWKKHATVEELGEYYEQQGIIKKPIGMTEKFNFVAWRDEGIIPIETFPWRRDLALEQERYFEIKKYLQDHPEITQWVAIDDLHMGTTYTDYSGVNERDWGLTNFVWTPNDMEGIKQTGIKEKILKFLE